MLSQQENNTADLSSSPSSFDLNSSLGSLVHLRSCDAYPKYPVPRHLDSNESSVASTSAEVAPFPLLPGEYLTSIGNAGDSIIALSNYRLFLRRSSDIQCQRNIQSVQDDGGQRIVNVPLGLLEQVESRDIFFLHIICKDARTIRCTFDTNEECLKWYKLLVTATATPKRIEDVFAFAHYAWMREDNPELHRTFANASFPQGLWPTGIAEERSHEEARRKLFDDEVRRMNFDLKTAWRISNVNEDFSLCASYPRELIVPASVKDEDLRKVARFRSSQRFPVVVWRHQENGCVIARCSQPEVGWLGYRDANDETMVREIATSCALDYCNGMISNNNMSSVEDTYSDELARDVVNIPTVLIMDARSYAAAVANKLKGGGCECSEYYPNCEVQFMGLANIHSIRKSFQSVRTLCAAYADHPNWFSGLENTKWLHHISGLLRSASVVANAIDRDRRPVLVHCSDGWDRTPQIVALAQLLLDPHYRTIDGFQVLVEREWLDFGHKFGDRCGNGLSIDDANERCPVFLQWLDCVYQLLVQFPCVFEFNANYLVKLSHHVYSCLYGTFLCNSEQERTNNDLRVSTHSVWALLRLNQFRYRNYLYARKESVLWPSCMLRDFVFWSNMYLQTVDCIKSDDPASTRPSLNDNPTDVLEVSIQVGSLLPANDPNLIGVTTNKCNELHSQNNLTKTRSCADLSSEHEMLSSGTRVRRRSSDPIFNDRPDFNNVISFDSFNTNHGFEDKQSNNILEADRDSEAEDDHTVNERRELRPFHVIESSTDTIVELAMNADERRPCDYNSVVKGKLSCVLDQGLHVSTSTTDISDSHVTISRKACQQHETHRRHCIDLPIERAGNTGTTSHNINDHMEPVRHCFYFAPSTSTPGHSRTPSSGFPATPSDERPVDTCGASRRGVSCTETGGVSSASSVSSSSSAAGNIVSTGLSRKFDIDGLPLLRDEVQQRLYDVLTDKQRTLNSLQHSLCLAKIALSQQVCARCNANVHGVEPEEVRSLPDSIGNGYGDLMSLVTANGNGNTSDVSWEQVEERDTRPTLWVPDHAVTRCMSCDSEFCIVRRKHHCRNCGKIFCSDCSNQMTPIPSEQLYHPVRVCSLCFNELGISMKDEFYNEQCFQKATAPDAD